MCVCDQLLVVIVHKCREVVDYNVGVLHLLAFTFPLSGKALKMQRQHVCTVQSVRRDNITEMPELLQEINK